MSQQLNELSGTWEEIVIRSKELTGHQLRVIMIPEKETEASKHQDLLGLLDELDQNPWTPQESAILDDFEQFQKDYPYRVLSTKGISNRCDQ